MADRMDADDVEEVTPTASPTRMADEEDDFELEDIEEDDDEPQIVMQNLFPRFKNVKNPCHNMDGSGPSGSKKMRPEPVHPRKQPDVIDLTEDEGGDDQHDDEMEDDSVVILDGSGDAEDMPELVEVAPVSKKEIAEDSRKTGNDHFKRSEYNQALSAYTRAIEMVPTEASYYGNRAACYMMMKRFKEALSDLSFSLQIDPMYEKSYLRLVRVSLSMGDVKACEQAITNYEQLKMNSGADIALEKHKLQDLKRYLADIEPTTNRQDFRRVLFLCDRILEISVGDVNMKIRKAFTLIKLGRHNEAAELATEIMSINPQSIDAHIIRALCHYQLDNMDKSLCFFRGGLQYNPDAEEPKILYRQVKQIKEKRESATELYKQGKYDESKALYLECLKVVSLDGDLKNTCLESKFYFNVSLIFNKQRIYDEALNYASKAINLNPAYYKAFVHRAAVHTSKDMYEEAVRDFEAALKIDPSRRELRQDIHAAKVAAKRAKRKDYYKILDIQKTASEEEIRKAYKKRALLHHPDRHASKSEAVQKEQEKHFKDVGEAYEVLSNQKKRERYDLGHDLSDIQSSGASPGFSYDPYDANNLFNMFFSSGGSSMGGMGGTRSSAGAGRYYNTRGGASNCSFGGSGGHR